MLHYTHNPQSPTQLHSTNPQLRTKMSTAQENLSNERMYERIMCIQTLPAYLETSEIGSSRVL